MIGQTFVMEQSLGLRIAGEEVGEADGGVVVGNLEGGEEGGDGSGVHDDVVVQ